LQRPPPEIRTLVSTSLPRSKIVIFKAGLFSAILIAEKKPAAPPPIIITSDL